MTGGDGGAVEAAPVPASRRQGWLAPVSARWQRLQEHVQSLTQVAAHLTPHLHQRKRSLTFALMASLGYMVLRLLEPWPLKLIVDHVLLGVPVPPSLGFLPRSADDPGGLLAVLTASIVAIALGSGLLYYWQTVLCSHIGQQVVAGLRLEVFRHLLRLDFAFHDRRRTGDLLVRLVADIRLLRDAVVKIPLDFSENSLLIIGMAVVMLVMDWQLALISFAALPVLLVLVRRYRKPMKAAIRQQRQQEGSLASIITESLGAVRLVQGLGLEEHEAQRLGGVNRKSVKEGVKAARIEAKLRWASDLAVGLVTAGVIFVAARRIMAGALSAGDLIVFVTYLRTFARPLRRVSRTTEQVTRTTTAGARIIEILDLKPGVCDASDALPAPPVIGEIRFEGVGLRHGRYPWVLRDIDLTVHAGERLGIVGPTGAGKTSLVQLIPRFYDPTEGHICVDGLDVRTFTLGSLRSQVTFIFQEPVLFATSVADNIAAGRRGATREAVVAAARQAGIHDLILGLAEGYETMLGERGGTLSGGQRQCVAIARAILRDAPIVVLDEPTTGLDQRAAARVIEALEHLMRGRTVLMISHELHRLRNVDRIVVLEKGRLVQQGEYRELAGRHGLFSELVAYGEVR